MQRHCLITAALVLVTLVAFEPLRFNDFIRFDDGTYITYNAHVLGGLTSAGVGWAFNVGSNGNWHPLTWLSHMLDVSLWGVDPRGHHLTNLALHATSVVVLFQLMRLMTGKDGRSAFVAAVFAVHPLHVESVAWAAERKDVLSTLFGFVSLWFWVKWTKTSSGWRYWTSLACFALSLAAKPMLVSLPLLLLLLDYWPLARLGWPLARLGTGADAAAQQQGAGSLLALVREKVPFFALAIASCAMTIVAQTSGKAVTSVDELPLSMRLGTAVNAYVQYLSKAIWPTKLAVFYPYPTAGVPVVVVAVGSVLLVAATIAVIYFARRLPWLAVGWLWWVGMLVPVSGIVQVGRQAMADRYTYVPLVGLSIIVAWAGAELLSGGRIEKIASAALALSAVCACVVLTRAQVKLWKDDQTLFEHTAKVTERNGLAEFRLGYDMMEQKKFNNAVAHYYLAVQYDPEVADAHNDYGVALMNLQRYDEAIEQFSQMIQRKPEDVNAHFNRARALFARQRLTESIADIREGLRLDPTRQDGRQLLDEALGAQARRTPAPPTSTSR